MIAKMRQLMTISVICLIQFGLQVNLFAQNDTPEALEFQEVLPTRVAIELDGDITDAEWGHAIAIHNPEFYIPKSSGDSGDLVIFEEHGGGTWEGEDDQSTTTRFLYDSENLYVSHVVVDDYHENEANSGWNGDAAQIMIADEDRELQIALYNFALGGIEDDYDDVVIHEEAGPGGVDAVVTRDAGITSYEIMLPAFSMELDEPLGPGTVVGFGVAINDGDEFETGQKGWGGLGAHAIVFGKTPLETVELTFVEDRVVGDALQAGDSDQDLDFDQLDLVQVQVSAKYLTGQAATWGEGDWNGAPGGTQGNPPAGDGSFNQLDIISALGPGHYLTGPYAAIATGGTEGDGQTSLKYDAGSGELSVDAPAGTDLTSINITSAGSKFVGDKPAALDGAFDNFAADNVFKATFGGSFGSISFGNILPAGISEADVAADLSAVGSLAGGGDLGDVDLVYIPEPTAAMLILSGLLGISLFRRRR